SQKCGNSRGPVAIERSRPAKGSAQSSDMQVPGRCVASEARAGLAVSATNRPVARNSVICPMPSNARRRDGSCQSGACLAHPAQHCFYGTVEIDAAASVEAHRHGETLLDCVECRIGDAEIGGKAAQGDFPDPSLPQVT